MNANGEPSRFGPFELPVIADPVEGFAGPLAGILAGLDWAAVQAPCSAWMLSAPADCPFLPHDLVARLSAARMAQRSSLAVAESGGRSHPIIALWSVALRDELRHVLQVEGLRKVGAFTARYQPAIASWPIEPHDPFFNVNTVDELEEAERLCAIAP